MNTFYNNKCAMELFGNAVLDFLYCFWSTGKCFGMIHKRCLVKGLVYWKRLAVTEVALLHLKYCLAFVCIIVNTA